jgi:hypothetical protein
VEQNGQVTGIPLLVKPDWVDGDEAELVEEIDGIGNDPREAEVTLVLENTVKLTMALHYTRAHVNGLELLALWLSELTLSFPILIFIFWLIFQS